MNEVSSRHLKMPRSWLAKIACSFLARSTGYLTEVPIELEH